MLKDKDNHTSCECGNKTIYEYMWTDANGELQSCPLCMVEWQSSQIEAMKELLYELSSKSKEETANAINQKYAELMMCEVDDFIDDINYSALEKKRSIAQVLLRATTPALLITNGLGIARCTCPSIK